MIAEKHKVFFFFSPSKLNNQTQNAKHQNKLFELQEAHARAKTEAAVPARVLLHTLILYVQHVTSALYTHTLCNQTNTGWCHVTTTLTHTYANKQDQVHIFSPKKITVLQS